MLASKVIGNLVKMPLCRTNQAGNIHTYHNIHRYISRLYQMSGQQIHYLCFSEFSDAKLIRMITACNTFVHKSTISFARPCDSKRLCTVCDHSRPRHSSEWLLACNLCWNCWHQQPERQPVATEYEHTVERPSACWDFRHCHCPLSSSGLFRSGFRKSVRNW